MRGCCRSRGARIPRSTGICQALETSGANELVWPVSTATGVKILVQTVVSGTKMKVELFSFLDQSKCDNAISRWLIRQKESILGALKDHPELFLPYLRTGLTLGKLSTLARTR